MNVFNERVKVKIQEFSPIGIIQSTIQLIKYNRKSLFLFTIIYKSITLLIMLPLLSLCSNFVLRRSGYSYITTENLLSVVTSPLTGIMAIVLLILLAIFATIEVGALYSCFQHSRDCKKILARQMLFDGIVNTIRIFYLKKIIYLLYALFMVPMVNCLLIIFTIKIASIPSYIIKSLFHVKYIPLIAGIAIGVLFVITILLLFTSHFCIGERKGFKASIRNSIRLVNKRKLRTAWYLLVWNGLIAGLLFLLYLVVMVIIAVSVVVFVKDSMVLAMFLSILDKVNLFVLLILGTIGVLSNMAIISAMYYRYKKENGEDVRLDALRTIENRETKTKAKQWLGVLISVVMIVNVIYFYNSFYNGVFGVEDALSPIKITSHRGNSISAPENTMYSIASAVEELADYAEIDVQETKDGVVVLLHDPSLKRTTGVNKYIWELTYDEVLELDAGSWFSEEFVDAKIPTLEEVLRYCKGKINLNIELKLNGHSQDLESKVVNLIELYGFERQCVITSANYESLVNVKKLNTDLKTGFIMSIVYGDFYDKKYIDFFSMKSSFITQRVVKEAHSRGKEIHAWTVNTKNEMDRLKNMGVDNIITDKPVKAREVLYSRVANQSIQDLIKRVVNQ
ncbi:glycerophosphodiester phosphodiesterase family protein [Anaerosporobacter sp.]